MAKRLSADIVPLREYETPLSAFPRPDNTTTAVSRAIEVLNAALPHIDTFANETIERRRIAVAAAKARMEEQRVADEGPVKPSKIVPTRWYLDSVEIS